MAVSTDNIGKEICRLTIDGASYLGIRVSAHKRSLAGQLQDSRKGHGWIVTGDRIETWEMNGLIEHDGEIYAYGPYRDGKPLSDLLNRESEEAVAGIAAFVAAVAAMGQRNITLSRFLPDALLRDREGAFLFLPQPIVDAIRNAQTERERIESYERFNHPDLKDERNLSFFVGVMLYRVLTGSFPFAGATSEELHQRMREEKIPAPILRRPEIRPEVSEAIMRSLNPAAPFPLADWQRFFERWSDDGLFREISEEERAKIAEEAERVRKKGETSFRRRVFFQRNWRTMAIVAAIVIVVGAIGGSIIHNATKPRITVGMPPEKVVNLFYTSITKLDSQAMQDCVIGSAGKAQINEATNLFVISRVREGYEGTTGFVSAQTWIDQGKPKLPPSMSVYGVADLKITKEGAGVYTVSYQKWEPVQQQNAGAPPSAAVQPIEVQGWNRVDRVYLKNEGKFWAIDKIENLKNSPVSPPIDVTNMSAKEPSPAQLPPGPALQ